DHRRPRGPPAAEGPRAGRRVVLCAGADPPPWRRDRDPRLRPGGARRRAAGARVDDRRPRRDAPPVRPGGRRDHDRPAVGAALRRVAAAWHLRGGGAGGRPGRRGVRRARRAVVALACATCAVAVLAPSAGAQGAPSPPGGDQPDPPPGEGLSAAVAAMPLRSAALDRAEAALADLEASRRADLERLSVVSGELETSIAEATALSGLVTRRDAQLDKAEQAHARAREALRVVAVEWFVTGFGAMDGLDPALTAAERDELAHHYVLSEAAALAALEDEEALSAHVASVRAERELLAGQLRDVEGRRGRLERERDRLVQSIQDAERRLPELERRVVEEQMAARVDGTDLSATALDAYWRAQ